MKTYSIWVKREKGETWTCMARGLSVDYAAAMEDMYRRMGKHYLVHAEQE